MPRQLLIAPLILLYHRHTCSKASFSAAPRAQKNSLKSHGLEALRKNGIPDKIRTCNLRLRRPTLYPIELRGH